MREPARFIIPVWGEGYATKLISITLPAVLAPGNLPALSELFDVELVIVTETRLFDLIQGSRAFQAAEKLCATRLVSLDDLMLDSPIDYGAVLTHALFRGFADLGQGMTERYLIFLNADFIVSDGSLGHLGKLMAEGKRVIHAPSFRVTREDVLPQLVARVDGSTCTLRLSSREMVRLALANKHRTVKARTVNQRLTHQIWMDQYYWYVDQDTLIGYQWPVALVAIKPERVVTSPVLVWDYGFVPEAAPTLERYFIGDSDDFFMLEPQSGESGDVMIRPGWISFDDIARNLSMWTTREQRECGRQLLKIHACDLPANLDEAIEESRAYMAEIYRRLSSDPVSHIDHTYLQPWFEGATERMRGRGIDAGQQLETEAALAAPSVEPQSRNLATPFVRILKAIYRATFGVPPQINKLHPLWADLSPLSRRIAAWREEGARQILWISSRDSVLQRLLGERVEPSAFLTGRVSAAVLAKAPYDGCICNLMLDELRELDYLYAKIRPLMKDGAHIAVSVAKEGIGLDGAELTLEKTAFPSIDISEVHFFGTTATWLLSRSYLRVAEYFSARRSARVIASTALLAIMAPLAWCANVRAARRESEIFSPTWTSLVIDFMVKRARPMQQGTRTGPRQLIAEAAKS
jgi:hypothetical protein